MVSGQFTGCDQVFELDGGGSTTIRSPNYPSAYPIGTNCRYQVTAPSFWKLTANCYVDVGVSNVHELTNFRIFLLIFYHLPAHTVQWKLMWVK